MKFVARQGCSDVTELLIESGADVNAKNALGRSASKSASLTLNCKIDEPPNNDGVGFDK